jgi:uncharacterized protein (DUF1800 family)
MIPLDKSVLALQRFGLGARPGDLARAEADPVAVLLTEIDRSRVMIAPGKNLMSSQRGILAVDAFVEERRKRLLADPEGAKRARPSAGNPRPMAPSDAMGTEGEVTAVPGQQIYRNEVVARYEKAGTAASGFAERLVWFWSNHFAVSIRKAPRLLATAGALEREVIRPHVFGRFADMLLAVEQHPAMIIFLDNTNSIGPNSAAGARRGRGLNENLAREILELHTLGVNGGYTQEDVIGLAKIITGWTVPEGKRTLNRGHFYFDARRHEPGAHTVLKRVYSQPGIEQGQAVLIDLARHRSTARHIATKLVRHFVADEPPQSMVDRLAKVFLDTDGDLAKVSRALVQAPEAWENPATKLRSPQEFLAGMLRATGTSLEGPQLLRSLLALDHRPWSPQGPDGFPDTVAYWASPSGMRVRLDVATVVARRAENIDPSVLVGQILGSTTSDETRSAVAGADSREQGLAILFASPEFQRR